MTSSCLKDEIIALQEIFYKEFSISINDDGGATVCIIINPDSGFDDPDDLLVTFILKLVCPSEYPAVGPSICIEDVRGFDEQDIEEMLLALESLMKDSLGDAMLYDLIMKAKEFCAENCPHAVCPICMCPFKSANDVFRTTRYHYFHRRCVAQYMHERRRIFEEESREILEKDPHRPEDKRPKFVIPCPTCQATDDVITYDKRLVEEFAPSFSAWSGGYSKEDDTNGELQIPTAWLKMRAKMAEHRKLQQEVIESEKKKTPEDSKENKVALPIATSSKENTNVDLPQIGSSELDQMCAPGDTLRSTLTEERASNHHRYHHRGRQGKRFTTSNYHHGRGYSRFGSEKRYQVARDNENYSRNGPRHCEYYYENTQVDGYYNSRSHHRHKNYSNSRHYVNHSTRKGGSNDGNYLPDDEGDEH